MNIRRKWWAASAAGLLAAYTLAGFWLVPLAIKHQVPKFGQTELARHASIGEVSFNPYTLRLDAQDLRLAEADGAPLLAIDKLALELQWKSLLLRTWSFAEVRISAPRARLAIAPDGHFNVGELLATLARRPHAASADTALPRLIIERFVLTQGKVEMRDRRAGYAETFSPIDIALTNFSTLPEHKGAYTLSADSARGGKLRWKGEVSVNPISGSGELVVENVPLPELAAYLKPYTRATLTSGQLAASLPYRFSYGEGKLQASLAGATLALRDLALVQERGAKDAFATLTRVDVSGISADLRRRKATVEQLQAEGGQLQLTRDHQGQFNIPGLMSKFGGASGHAAAPASGTPWFAVAKRVELSKFGVEVADQGTGIKVNIQDLAVSLEGASSDIAQPVKFNTSLRLREGGELSAQGNVVPASGALDAELRVKQLALAPLQPLLGKYVKLNIAGGSFSAQGRLTAGAGRANSARLRYAGGFDIDGLALKEERGDLFAAWKHAGADEFSASLDPNLLEIAELRLVEPSAKLIIENDRSFNAVRLLIQPPASAATVKAPAHAAEDTFPVRIKRLRFKDAKLEFGDLSLRPQFSAKIYELNGVVTGLSSKRDSRSQIELDGRVDEFGSARIRGELNPFAPRDNTDISLVFKNVDMVSASPYSMKFAGYKVAEGKISLDLNYRVRNSHLVGSNRIVIDKLSLGERVDSPDALKLPLELAIAILKDSDGRIDLGLPISGDLSNPQFSYGALIWKAVTNVLTRIVSAPFAALGRLFGVSGDKLESVDFDPGSYSLLPPEREKLKQLAQVLSKRPQLKLSVPGQYSEAADGAALRARALRVEIAKRAGIKLDTGEDPGPLDLRASAVRSALRNLYAERFGAAELDKQAAESTAATPAGSNPAAAQENLPIGQRAGKLVQGEPQLVDSSAFYQALLARLNQSQSLATDALRRLGVQRASAVLAYLKQAGVDPSRAIAAAPEPVKADLGKPVALKLGLGAK